VTTVRPGLRPTGVAALRRPVGVRLAWLFAGLVLLVILGAASLAFGARDVSLTEIFAALGGGAEGVGEAAVTLRMPRTALAMLVGAALALSGCAMQAITRNPLADPGILGVSSGAALAVVIGIAFFGLSNPYSYIGVATLGAAGASAFVYAVGSMGRGGATPLKLAVAGAASAAAFSSLVRAILLPRVDILETFRFWQIGGVGGASWDRILVGAPFLGLGALICLISARGMNSLALGDDMAAGLGVRVGQTRLLAAVGAVILAGAATAIAGPIGFVGLVIPHMCRMLIGTDHRWLLPFSALAGAALLTASDIIGRVIAPSSEEIQVGIITALIGAPFFIWIVRKQKVREL